MTTPPVRPSVEVPRLWPGATVVCLGGGPSLTQEDVDTCRGMKVIAINDAHRLAPWADVLYSGDLRWIKHYNGVPAFAGLKFSIEQAPRKGDREHQRWPEWQVLRNMGTYGLEPSPVGLRTGRNSGAQAIGLAVHLGASRILLLGYDMGTGEKGKSHWFGEHPYQCRATSPYLSFRDIFKQMVQPLHERGVEAINCSRETHLKAFPRRLLAEVIRPSAEVAA